MILLSAASALVQSANVVYEADRAIDVDEPVGVPNRVATDHAIRPSNNSARSTRRSTNGCAAAPDLQSAALASQRAVQRPRQPRHRHGRTSPSPIAPRRAMPGRGDRRSLLRDTRAVVGARPPASRISMPAPAPPPRSSTNGSSRATLPMPIRSAARCCSSTSARRTRRRRAFTHRRHCAAAAATDRHGSHAGRVRAIRRRSRRAIASADRAGTRSGLRRSSASQVRQLDADLPVFNLQSLERVSYMSRWIPRIMSCRLQHRRDHRDGVVGAWPLLADRLRDVATHAGDRRADGARRATRAGVVVVSAPGTDAGSRSDWRSASPVPSAIGGVLQGALVDVRANDPLTLAAVAAFLVAISIAAALVPSRRAARLDPVTALRQD